MDKTDRLGNESVGKLLLTFSLPAITGMLVNALYNIVDKIFVGRGVNEAALGGLSIAAPMMTVIMAFAMLLGGGTANLISIKLGEKKKDEAENALNHCLFLLTGMALILMLAGQIFLEPLMRLFGGREGSASMGYAVDYMRIILYGAVFNMVSFGFSHCTRAQGFPKITMIGMLMGAGLNAALDPLFIFVFHWGVKGAAFATIISQFASMCWLLTFSFGKKASVRLDPKRFKPSIRMTAQIAGLGSAQFLLQIAASFIAVWYNVMLTEYGNTYFNSSSGGDTALAAFNVINSVAMMIMMPVFGINQGAQPILGYNYGAEKYDRVRKAYIYAALAATGVTCAGFGAVQLFAGQIVGLFTSEASPELMGFTPNALKTVLLLMPIVGAQVVSSNFFVATGHPKMSIVLSMLRQIIVLAPCIIIFSSLWALDGIIWAAPVSDGASAAITAMFIIRALRKLKNGERIGQKKSAPAAGAETMG